MINLSYIVGIITGILIFIIYEYFIEYLDWLFLKYKPTKKYWEKTSFYKNGKKED